MTKETESYIGVYRAINEIGPAITDRRWQDLESIFAADVKVHHSIMGEMTGPRKMIEDMKDHRLASHYLAGNIRISPPDGDTVRTHWDFAVTLLYPREGGPRESESANPYVFKSGARFAAEFRPIDGRWRIVDMTSTIIWIDPEMYRYKMALLKSRGD